MKHTWDTRAGAGSSFNDMYVEKCYKHHPSNRHNTTGDLRHRLIRLITSNLYAIFNGQNSELLQINRSYLEM